MWYSDNNKPDKQQQKKTNVFAINLYVKKRNQEIRLTKMKIMLLKKIS